MRSSSHWSSPYLLTILIPLALDYLDLYLHGHPLGMIGVQPRVQNLIHPDDHDLFAEPRYLLGLLFGALDDLLVLCRENQVGVEVKVKSLRGACS